MKKIMLAALTLIASAAVLPPPANAQAPYGQSISVHVTQDNIDDATPGDVNELSICKALQDVYPGQYVAYEYVNTIPRINISSEIYYFTSVYALTVVQLEALGIPAPMPYSEVLSPTFVIPH